MVRIEQHAQNHPDRSNVGVGMKDEISPTPNPAKGKNMRDVAIIHTSEVNIKWVRELRYEVCIVHGDFSFKSTT